MSGQSGALKSSPSPPITGADVTSLAPSLTIPLRPLLVAVAVLTVAVVGVFAVREVASGEPGDRRVVSGPASAPFELRLPAGWKALPKSDLAQLPGGPLAVVRSADGNGTIVVARSGRTTLSFPKLATGLRRRLKTRFADLREVSAKVMTLPAGRALVYSFARTKSGVAQTTAIIPSGTSTYTLNAIIRPGAPAIAREVGAMLGGFDIRSAG